MSYATFAHTTFSDMLATLDHLAGKAQAAGMGDDVLEAKLAEDMFPLETQFRVALNQVILALGRVAGCDAPLEETAYASLAEIRERIGAVRALLDEAGAEAWIPAEERFDFTLPNDMRFAVTSEDYIRDWTMPNFYFHVTMAYALLRHRGLDIGKLDFLQHMARHAVAPAA